MPTGSAINLFKDYSCKKKIKICYYDEESWNEKFPERYL